MELCRIFRGSTSILRALISCCSKSREDRRRRNSRRACCGTIACMSATARTRPAWINSTFAWPRRDAKRMPAWWTRSARWCAEIMARAHVLVVTRRTTRKNKYIEYVGEYHLDNLIRAGLLPVMIPVVPGTFSCLPQYTEKMKGLLLVEGEDVEPVHYRARRANFRYLEKTDPAKDQIEIRLLRQALRRRLPILGICRGSQLLNVVCGGTLFGDVQKEKRSSLKHINYDHYDSYRHRVTIVAV